MRKPLRWLLALAVLLVVAGAVAWIVSAWRGPGRGRLAGTYAGAAFDSRSTFVLRLAPDGSSQEEVYPPGASRPKSVIRGRWRVSHGLLVLENGGAASTSVGLGQSLGEMFEGPSLGNEVSKFRIVSADDTGLVLGLEGGVTWELARRPEP
jgi:hypothetical protein